MKEENDMDNNLADSRTVEKGPTTYKLLPSGGQGAPPTYTVKIERSLSGTSPEKICAVTFTGVEAHNFCENGELVGLVMDAIVTFIKRHDF